jgi:hypothetical protein
VLTNWPIYIKLRLSPSHESLIQCHAFKINNFSNTNIDSLREKSSANATKSLAGQTLDYNEMSEEHEEVFLLVKFCAEDKSLT